MFTKIVMLLSIYTVAMTEEQPFLDLKKVIRGALDVVAAVPTSTPANYGVGGTSQLAASNGGVQGIDPVVQEKLSRLFHIPPDFVHRLAAQTGYIDYEPTTTTKPSVDYWFRPQPRALQINPEYSTGSFVQENPTNTFSSSVNNLSAMTAQQNSLANLRQAVDSRNILEQRAVVFQPILKDGHLYYQPFGVLPQAAQPQMIVYGGRIYMATPVQNEQQNREVTMSVPSTKNPKETYVETEKESVPETNTEADKQMRNRRIYAEYVRAAEDAQVQAAQLQKAAVPNISPIEIPGIESKPVVQTSLPYRKVYNLKELENYYALQQFDAQKKAQESSISSAFKDGTTEGQQLELLEIQFTTPLTPQPTATTISPNVAADNVEYTSRPLRQLPINQVDIQLGPNRESYAVETDEVSAEQSTSNQQADTAISKQFPQEKEEQDENTDLVSKSHHMQRILALRRKMAADRKKFAERKRLLSSMKRKVNKAENTDREIFRRHCYNIRSFARQFGVLDIKQYAISNCAFIENYYPDLKCGEVEIFVDRCLELFRQDEFQLN